MKPKALNNRKGSRLLELRYENGDVFELSWEFLRVHSPSAEVRGHGASRRPPPAGKAKVELLELKPAGHYAVQLLFDDGHDSGLYTWAYLRELCANQKSLWAAYQNALRDAGQSRDPDTQVLDLR